MNNFTAKHVTHVGPAYEVAREDIGQLDEDVIFGGSLTGHFGHFTVEHLCRMWYVLQHPELNLKILFIIATWGYRHWFEDFFRLMGIDKDRIVYVDKPTQCRSVIVPEQAQYWNSYTKEWTLPFQAIKSHVKPAEFKEPKKLYLTRTKLGVINANVHNEKYFEDFFAARGFEIVSPEKLTLDEQMSLIMGADEIAATLGTLTHWALFCKPTAKFIMLLRTSNDDGRIQRFINNVFKNYYIVDVSKNFMFAYHNVGEFLIGSTKYWKEFVADYFGEEISEDDDHSYLDATLDKYVDFWCRRYVGSQWEHFDKIVGVLRNMCTKIVAQDREKLNPQSQADDFQVDSSEYLKKFVANYFGEEISEDDDHSYLDATLDKYTEFWCRRYVGEQSAAFSIILGSLRDVCTRIVALERGKLLNRPLLTYQTHVDKFGWGEWKSEEQFSNPINQKRDIQAVKINFSQPFHDVFYSVYYGDSASWSQEVSNGSQAGTTGLKKSITGIKIHLDEAGTNEFDILYRVHTFDGVWSPWAKNGELLYAHEVKLNALQIKLVSK